MTRSTARARSCPEWPLLGRMLLPVLGLFCGLAAHAAQPAPPGVLLEPADVRAAVESVRAGRPAAAVAFAALVEQADAVLEQPVAPITSGKAGGDRVAPSGDPRDYVSLSPYWWPNPDTDDGLPYVRRDGIVNPDRGAYDTRKLETFCESVRVLAFAFALGGDERYAARAAEHLRAWFISPDTRMNPHLQYSQFVPGVSEGRSYGIIDSTRLRWVADATLLLEPSASWSEDDTQAVRAWYSAFTDWLLTSTHGRQERAAPNNHGTWYGAQVMQYALFAGRESVVRELAEELKARIPMQIMGDGSQPEELARTRSLHYSAYNLRAYQDACRYARAVGVDLAGYRAAGGQSIRAALDFIAPYLVDASGWSYPQISPIDPALSYQMLRIAARTWDDPRYEIAARALPELPEEHRWIDLLLPAVHEPPGSIDGVSWGQVP